MEEDKTNEEIEIDFSKVKNLFKKKKKESKNIEEKIEKKPSEVEEIEIETKDPEKEEQKHVEIEKNIEVETKPQENEDEEVKIDFSKVKGLFKKKEEHKSDNDALDLDIKQSLKSTFKFIKKYHIVLLLLIPIFLSLFFRSYPIYLPVTDEWAENSVYNNIQSNIKSQINQQYPNLPDANKDALVESEMKKVFESQSDDINQQIKGTSDYFKSKMQDDAGQTYLLAIDPYLWYGEIKASLDSGFFGNEVIDGKERYTLRNGRFGRAAESVLVVNLYAGKYLYKIMNFFNKNVSVMAAFFLIPMIIITLSTIPAFFIGRKIGGNIAGLFAGIIVAINSSLLGRTPAGFADTDPYNIFFPLFIAWMFIEAIESKTNKKRIIYSCISGFLVGLYTKAWTGWWYPMMFVLASLGLCFIYYTIINFKELKKGFKNYIKIPNIQKTLIIFSGFFGISFLSSLFFVGFERFFRGILGPLGFTTIKNVAVKSYWPNVLTTVAEFNIVPLKEIMNQMGGSLLFFIAIVGIILSVLIKKKNGERDIMYATFLVLWFLGTAYAFTKGTRFAILMVPAFAISFGIALGITYKYTGNWLAKAIHINKYLSKTLIILVFVLLLIAPLKAANNIAKNEIPSMTDAWYESLTAIKEDSEDAMITSWWDFGHWFVAISERRVTFDGADQGERIHWVGKTLLTNNEAEAVGILRMLNCGQQKAPHKLESYLENDTIKAIDLLNQIMIVNKEQATDILKNEKFSDVAIADVLNVTHCENLIDPYYITSEDMIGKAGVWGHFGSWDFEKAKMYKETKGISYEEGTEFLKEEFNLTEETADKIFYEIQSTEADRWVSPWPGYMGGPYSSTMVDDSIVCSNGIQINLTDYTALVPTQQGLVNPTSLVYATKQGLIEKKFKDSPMGVSLALIPEGKSYSCLLLDPLHATGTFTRLFFFDGHGSKYFKKFSDKTTFTGQRIIVWKVSWEPGTMVMMEELEEKTNVKSGNQVSLNYIGWTEKEGIFDSSIANWKEEGISNDVDFSEYQNNDFSFQVGSGQVIPGFDKGVLDMKKGATKIIEIPPEEAYGTDPDAHQLGNKTLFFKIKLIDIS